MSRLASSTLNTALDSHSYLYDAENQRTQETRNDASTVAYSYDNIGQLKVADNSVNSEDRGYYYDAAWNLNRRTNNGVTSTFIVDTKEPANQCSQPRGRSDLRPQRQPAHQPRRELGVRV